MICRNGQKKVKTHDLKRSVNMKVVNVIGSPRGGGNSAKISEIVTGRLKNGGHTEVRNYNLNEIVFRGCQGCMSCKTGSDVCVVKDGLTEVLASLRDADIAVFSSPVYFGEITGQAKSFVDRCYSLLKSDYRTNPKPGRLASGKKLVFIITQGNPDENLFAGIAGRYAGAFGRFGFDGVHTLVAGGLAYDADVSGRANITEKINIISEKLTDKKGN
jgi:multimeric flavodoxin WrbA